MGFLSGSSAATTIDPSLEAIFMVGCSERHSAKAMQALVRNQKHVLAVTSALRPSEEALLLAGESDSSEKPSGDFLLVTNQRSIHISGSYAKPEIEHSDVVEIVVGSTDFKIVVLIHSRTSRLDYRPNDRARFHHIISHGLATPRQAARIRELIEGYTD